MSTNYSVRHIAVDDSDTDLEIVDDLTLPEALRLAGVRSSHRGQEVYWNDEYYLTMTRDNYV